MNRFRSFRALAFAWAILSASPGLASQATIVGPVVGPHTMADVMGTINGAFLAIQSCNSGSSAPANGPSSAPVSFQWWCDTTANPAIVKMFDGSSWVVVGKVNTSTHVFTPSYQGTDTGTASTATTGTSGHTLGFLDAANTYSAVQSGATAVVDTNTTQFATTAFVLAQAASATPLINGTAAVGTSTRFARGDHVHPTDTTRAPLASPALTGTPTAPTAAVDTNTTQIATQAAIIQQAASATPLIDGTAAVGTSTRFARGDHVHPTDTTRAPLASPTFTGTPAAPTASPGTNTTQIATSAFVQAAVAAATAGVATYNGRNGTVTATGTDVPLRSYLAGLTLSAAGGTTSFGIAAGVATDSSNAAMMALASAFTKTSAGAGSWVVGSGNGGLDTGTLAAGVYHIFLIERPDTGVVDVCYSTSPTAPTTGTNIPVAYTSSRRIGSITLDGSAHWVGFVQDGDLFQKLVPAADITATNPGTSAVSRTLSVPTGVNVVALLQIITKDAAASANIDVFISDLATTDTAPTISLSDVTRVVNGTAGADLQGAARVEVRTNTSAQVRSRLSGSGTSTILIINTLGWIDRRGRDL